MHVSLLPHARGVGKGNREAFGDWLGGALWCAAQAVRTPAIWSIAARCTADKSPV